MEFDDEDLIVDSIMSGEKEKIYEQMKEAGSNFYQKDFELFFLHEAFYALVGFMMEEEYEICGVISASINGFIKKVNRPDKNISEQISRINKYLEKNVSI